jgi:crotonobetaine/carnitine-CoA ligase
MGESMASRQIAFREWFEEKVNLGKTLPFLRFKDEVFTYEQVNDSVNRVSNALSRLGIKKGSKVALMMSNRPEFVHCWFGLAKIGAISLFVNVDLRSDGLVHLLRNGDAECVIIDRSRLSQLEAMGEALPSLNKIICAPNSDGVVGPLKTIPFDRLLGEAPSVPPPEVPVEEGEPMGFIHTAGTTGLPKWAILSHKAYITGAENLREWAMTHYKDIFYNPLPLFHINPQMYFLLNALAGNASVVITEKYSASNLWKEVCRYGATVLVLHTAPGVYALKQPVIPEETQHRVRMLIVPGSRLFIERFKIPVLGSGYGSTELPGFVALQKFYLPLARKWDRFGDGLNKFAGKPVSYVDIKICDERDQEVSRGQIGQILVRGKEPHVIFDGYYNMSEKTKEVLRRGWFHTGDAGRFDEEGNLIYEGRTAESISVKGEWVHIDEVEAAIRSFPTVVDVAVVGVSAEAGNDIMACVQMSEGHTLDPADLLDYCQTKLARFMVPRYVEVVREFPRTPGTEKIQKEILKKRGIGNAWDREKAGYTLKR